MRKLALVFAGGFCGALARYFLAAPLLALAVALFPAAPKNLPYDIFAINLTGAFALGLLYGLAERGSRVSPEARLLLGTGFLGAYTTFSTFTYGGDTLLGGSHWLLGLIYLGGSLALGIVCVELGQMAAHAIHSRQRIRVRARVRTRRLWRQAQPARSMIQPWRLSRRASYSSSRRMPYAAHPQSHNSHSGAHRAVHSQRSEIAELTPEEELL